MKKIFNLILVLSLLWGGNAYAADVPIYENNLNKNILKHGWIIESKSDGGLVATEIYHLKKNKWILICTVKTSPEISTICKLP